MANASDREMKHTRAIKTFEHLACECGLCRLPGWLANEINVSIAIVPQIANNNRAIDKPINAINYQIHAMHQPINAMN